MQLITIASGALFVAAASANADSSFKASFDASKPYVKVYNKCPYKLYAWSVAKGQGCPSDQAIEVETGGFYAENYRPKPADGGAISIKFSGQPTCAQKNLTQVEYCHDTNNPGYEGNFVDMSYVDCESGECPSRKEGFYYQIGNQPDASGSIMYAMDQAQNCPIWSCKGGTDCDKYAYIKWNDDHATRFCNLNANWEVYLCDPSGPKGGAAAAPVAAPSSKQVESKVETPSKAYSSAPVSSSAASSSTPSAVVSIADYKKAAVTPKPEADPKTKYETVIVTQTAYKVVEEDSYKVKRHFHGHQHRHFHA
jgi:hypothetical protein